MPRLITAFILLAVAGTVSLPLEQHLTTLRIQAGYSKEALSLSLREKLGQMAFLAALSGFRSFVAAVGWIETHVAWEKLEWGRMAGLIDTVTTLQPNSALYWDNGSWHMAWNAAINARDNVAEEPSEALRTRAERQYVELGRRILEEGIRNNPDNWLLKERLGLLLWQRAGDHCAAAEAYAAAAATPDAPPYLKRMAAYELAQCPGKEREAYTALREIYDLGPEERKPSVIRTLQQLEENLGIPPEQRIETTANSN